MSRVDHLAARLGGNLRLVAQVEVNLRAGAAGTRLAHLPEVVVLVAADDVVLGQILAPVVVGLLVEGDAVLVGTLEDGGVHPLGGQVVDVVQQLPRPADGLLLEVVAVGPVAQHLEHGVVVGVVSDLLQVVVLARDAQTLLRIGRTGILAGGVAQEDVLELVHARIGEHEGGVVLDDHGRRRHDGVTLACEEVQKCLADFVRFHIVRLRYNQKKRLTEHATACPADRERRQTKSSGCHRPFPKSGSRPRLQPSATEEQRRPPARPSASEERRPICGPSEGNGGPGTTPTARQTPPRLPGRHPRQGPCDEFICPAAHFPPGWFRYPFRVAKLRIFT